MDMLNGIFQVSDELGFSLVVITSSLPQEAQQFKENYLQDANFYYADDVTLMTMIRSNPGLILLKNGVIRAKWHYNDIPSVPDIKQEFLLP